VDSSILLDTNGWLALLNLDDSKHATADRVWCELIRRGAQVVLTDWIIAETGNGLARPRHRRRFLDAVETIIADPPVLNSSSSTTIYFDARSTSTLATPTNPRASSTAEVFWLCEIAASMRHLRAIATSSRPDSIACCPCDDTRLLYPHAFVTANRKLGFSGSNVSRSSWSVPRARLIIQTRISAECRPNACRNSER
jgi:predicted nucleic acid-binding protein